LKNIVVTGAGGFIGSHLTEFLVREGYNVKAFVHYNSNNFWGWLDKSEVSDSIEVVTGDIRDYDSVKTALKSSDTIFHLAALIGIPYSYSSPLAYIKTNVEGTYNVIQASRDIDVENVLITSTSETYGTAQYVPIDEKHPVVGQSPYAATKISADALALSFHKSFNLPVKVVRPFNTYGPRQSARAIIPTIISQLLAGKKEIHLGNLSPTRDLTFVRDTVKGFCEIAKSDALIGQATNIGMNDEIRIDDLANLIGELMDVDFKIVSKEENKRPLESEVERLCCDNTKLITHTNWEPDYDLKKGILETIAWLKQNTSYYKTDLYNV